MVRVALGQLNTTVGDLDGNVARMVEWTTRAADEGADLICFPELAITGYPPEDLVLRPRFVEDNLAALDALAAATAGSSCAVMVGFVDRSEQGLHNAAALIRDGRVQERYHKIQLPNFGVFDEKRYFVPGTAACSIRLASSELGLSVCEDAWHGDAPFDEYERTRPQVILNINGSPYHHGKGAERLEICPSSRAADRRVDRLRERGRRTGRARVRRRLDGGRLRTVRCRACRDVRGGPGRRRRTDADDVAPGRLQHRNRSWPTGPEEVYRALVLGLGDYVRKNGFREVVIGMSGGIDSALVADARRRRARAGSRARCSRCRLRTPRPRASRTRWSAPSVWASGSTRCRSRTCSTRIGARSPTCSPEPRKGVAEENLQARIRGNLLMALSNKFGSLVLATGNKSEYAVGYATLYGDMAGGFAPIKDVPKTLVYELAAWRNAQGPATSRRSPTGS